jgi:Asp-tRNA(Asn)/Glu-tRNA(Gln) amidotransferase C subunit
MPELTSAQVRALAEAVRLPGSPDDLAEVTHRLNAFLEVLAHLADLPLERVEPVPMWPDAIGPEAGAPPDQTR